MNQHLIIFCLTLLRHRDTIFRIADFYYGCQDNRGEKIALAMRAVSAVNANGELDLAGTDRLTESDKSYVQISSDWYFQTVNSLYATDNSADATTNSVTRQRLTGFTGTLTSELRSLDVYGNETITTVNVDRTNKKVTQTVDVPDSSSNIVMVSVNDLPQSQSSRTGLTTSYSYDALGRRNTVTDARLGNTVTHYDSHGWVDYTENAAGNSVSYTYSSGGKLASRTWARTSGANSLTTSYSYSDAGDLLHRSMPGRRSHSGGRCRGRNQGTDKATCGDIIISRH